MKRLLGSGLVMIALAVFGASFAACSDEKGPDARVSTPPIYDAAPPPAPDAKPPTPDAGAPDAT